MTESFYYIKKRIKYNFGSNILSEDFKKITKNTACLLGAPSFEMMNPTDDGYLFTSEEHPLSALIIFTYRNYMKQKRK